MENNSFEYIYSAQQQREVEAIRKKYLPKEEDKMEQLRRLHSIPTQKARAVSIAMGVIGALILGGGMHVSMKETASGLGDLSMITSIVIGLVGISMIALAYPAYHKVLRKERAKIAPEVLQLSEELLK